MWKNKRNNISYLMPVDQSSIQLKNEKKNM